MPKAIRERASLYRSRPGATVAVKFSRQVRAVLGAAAAVALILGVLMWANRDFPFAGLLLLAALSLTIGALSPSMKHVGWWLAVIATTLGAGLFSSLFYGLGMSNLVDKWIAGDEVRRFLLVWPPVLLVSTLAGGLVGTRSVRQALLISVGAVLGGVLTGAVGLPFEPPDGLPVRLLLGVSLSYFLVMTWIRRPGSLR